jgi:hypothetical protein
MSSPEEADRMGFATAEEAGGPGPRSGAHRRRPAYRLDEIGRIIEGQRGASRAHGHPGHGRSVLFADHPYLQNDDGYEAEIVAS